jgi:MSHA biogenesis protein MshK
MRFQKWMGLLMGSFLCVQCCFAELRDPTRPEGFVDKSTEVRTDSLELNAIFISSQRKVAVINGQVVKVGDEVSGVKVISIDENSVELEGADNRMTLYLVSTPVKTPVN